MCLVRSCWTGLLAISMAALLSQYNIKGVLLKILNSVRRICNHNNSHTPWAIE
uniref:Uncharacterized protein n=1 Tax=Arundo donax TaxID=35708 RepID=A0A0A9AAA1_ARUDO